MEAKTFEDRNRAAGAWLKNLTRPRRNGSRAHLVLVGGGCLTALIFVGAFAHKMISRHEDTVARVTSSVTTSGQHSPAFAPPLAHASAPASVAAPIVVAGKQAPTVPAVIPAAETAPIIVAQAQAPLTPPTGLVAGQVVETIANTDQYGQYSPVSVRALGAVRTSWQSYAAPSYSPAWRETLAGWFQLSTPASIAVLRRGGGAAAALVTAEIDGASIGPALRGPASEMAALPLAAGWHSFTVTAENKSLSYMATATPIELAIGNGTTPPMPVVPYAVVVVPPAASASTVLHAPAPAVSSATPAPQSKVTPPSTGAH